MYTFLGEQNRARAEKKTEKKRNKHKTRLGGSHKLEISERKRKREREREGKEEEGGGSWWWYIELDFNGFFFIETHGSSISPAAGYYAKTHFVSGNKKYFLPIREWDRRGKSRRRRRLQCFEFPLSIYRIAHWKL